MTPHPSPLRLLPTTVALTLALAVGTRTPSLTAQSSTDTLAISRAIVEVVLHEARKGGDHHGPFAFNQSAESSWGHAVAAMLRSEHSDLVVAPTSHALMLTVGDVVVFGDSAHATLTWARCEERTTHINSWAHQVVYLLEHASGVWHFARREIVWFADGHC
jgi:hypothetical protein